MRYRYSLAAPPASRVLSRPLRGVALLQYVALLFKPRLTVSHHRSAFEALGRLTDGRDPYALPALEAIRRHHRERAGRHESAIEAEIAPIEVGALLSKPPAVVT